ncbi:tyrosine-protein phosphatase [Streptomyces sp. NPDC055006]
MSVPRTRLRKSCCSARPHTADEGPPCWGVSEAATGSSPLRVSLRVRRLRSTVIDGAYAVESRSGTGEVALEINSPAFLPQTGRCPGTRPGNPRRAVARRPPDATLLTALGAPRDTVMDDYLAGNTYRAKENAAALAAMPLAQAAVYKPMPDVRPEYLNSGFQEVTSRYGTFDRYLDKALGLGHRDVRDLREDLPVG